MVQRFTWKKSPFSEYQNSIVFCSFLWYRNPSNQPTLQCNLKAPVLHIHWQQIFKIINNLRSKRVILQRYFFWGGGLFYWCRRFSFQHTWKYMYIKALMMLFDTDSSFFFILIKWQTLCAASLLFCKDYFCDSIKLDQTKISKYYIFNFRAYFLYTKLSY